MTKAEFLIKENGFEKIPNPVDEDDFCNLYEKITRYEQLPERMTEMLIDENNKRIYLRTSDGFSAFRYSMPIDKSILEMLNAIFEEF